MVALLKTLKVEVGVCTVEGEDSTLLVVVMLGTRLVNGSIVIIGGEEDVEGKDVTSIVTTEIEISIRASLAITITSSRWWWWWYKKPKRSSNLALQENKYVKPLAPSRHKQASYITLQYHEAMSSALAAALDPGAMTRMCFFGSRRGLTYS